MIEIATKIMEQLEDRFDPDKFKDRYEESLRELIRMKEKGKEPEVVEPPADTTNVIDLMDALKRSLGKKAPAKSEPAKRAAASRKVPRRKSR
jgi:DNA end-binding protein Ku